MELKVSRNTEALKGSEIIKIAAEINEKIKAGKKIHNLTIGDFNPEIFPIPSKLTDLIKIGYDKKLTNYPASNGILELRNSLSTFYKKYYNIDYTPNEFLVGAGARPMIFTTYKALLDPGDTVVFPVPSWNNNHYSHLNEAKQVMIETTAEQNFMPEAHQIAPHIQDATLITVCSPLNPTGTTMSKKQLSDICELILEENKRRKEGEKPVYLMYDQIYSMLTYNNTMHYNPIALFPEMKNYTIFIDGLSKAYAATGVRVGWCFGPERVIGRMKAVLDHIGAWAPKAEQWAVSQYLLDDTSLNQFMDDIKLRLLQRLQGVYDALKTLKAEGFRVDAIEPQSAIYLTAQFDIKGKKLPSGKTIENTFEITSYLLEEANLGIVPFYAFGANNESTWYRISVGTLKVEDIPTIAENLRQALSKLS